MGNITMKAKDAISAQLAECFVGFVDGAGNGF